MNLSGTKLEEARAQCTAEVKHSECCLGQKFHFAKEPERIICDKCYHLQRNALKAKGKRTSDEAAQENEQSNKSPRRASFTIS